jgi:hypothetical protein
MKKWLLISGAIAIVGVIYLFIPSKITISTETIGHRNISAADRCFQNISQWDKWWPKSTGCDYRVTGVFYSDVRVSMQCADNSKWNGDIRITPLNGDSTLISWECGSAGNDLFKRIKLSRHKKEIRQNMEAILSSFKTYIEDARNIYGVDFYRTMSNDFTLVTMTFLTTTYPTTAGIYLKIDSLRKYIISQGAKQMNPPMLNVSKISDTKYNTTIAISVNKRLAGNNRISIKNFVPWKMLEGEVHGGVYTVEKAFEGMQKYKIDYNISIMALPFQSLITDRRQEQDTTKWVTKICAPIS